MTCCDVDIDTCPPYASQESVIRAFESLNLCCRGTVGSTGIDPVTDPEDAMEEAFPDGLDTCRCEMISITNEDGDVWGSWDGGETFHLLNDFDELDCNACIGDEQALNQMYRAIFEPAVFLANAFPSGAPPICDCPMLIVPITTGPPFVSYDGGATFKLMGDQPACKLTVGSGQTFAGAGTGGTVDLSTIAFDRYGNMASVGVVDEIFVPVSGRYLFVAELNFNNAASTAAGQLQMTVEMVGTGGLPGIRETFYSNSYPTTTNTMAPRFVTAGICECTGPGEDSNSFRMNFAKAAGQAVPAVAYAALSVIRLP